MNEGSEPRGLRERKKLKARRELERVALELFRGKGFEQTTIREIADAADMSPRTFFRYFSSKEEVIFARASEDIEALKLRLRSRPESEPPYESVRHAFIEWADRLQDSREDISARVQLTAAAGALRRWAAQLRDEMAGEIARELAERPSRSDGAGNALVATVGVQAMTLALIQWSRAELDRPLRAFVRDSFEQLEQVIRAATPV
jgi:AcrR family transcriptional regulator